MWCMAGDWWQDVRVEEQKQVQDCSEIRSRGSLAPKSLYHITGELEYAKGFLFFLQPERIVLNHHARRSWSRLFREGFLWEKVPAAAHCSCTPKIGHTYQEDWLADAAYQKNAHTHKYTTHFFLEWLRRKKMCGLDACLLYMCAREICYSYLRVRVPMYVYTSY